ncbi:methyl-accepting chemotaxis protein [Photobacterium sanctipauli]|uniref:Methyl-accepting chemotaxis protein n=1 Tax=Photobacterium sanctipauli TaxID=1342794 RepID=A0A2T3NNV8_9GAMM|nr:methyl-accepting chemotaxis protein [Photobacterium sanctipauli]PSW17658.1 methyl-accepting chemotaxis protein [Photobacterium sanctipauli]
MRKPSLHTIKAQLFLVSIFLVTTMVGFGIFEAFSFKKLDQLQQAAQETANGNTDLLTLRRHEKDFLARLDPQYIEQFNQQQIALSKRLKDVQALLAQYDDSNNSQFADVLQALDAYSNQFNIIADQTILIGLTPQEGLRGNIRSAANDAEEGILLTGNELLYRMLLTLRRNEKDFLITNNPDHVRVFENNVENLISAISNSELTVREQKSLRRSIIMYQMMFDELVEGYTTIGLNYNEGLYGQLRSNVQDVEQNINNLEATIVQTINDEQNNEKLALMVAGTLVTLTMVITLIMISRRISSRLKSVNQVMEDIASGDGDLTVRMNDNGKDEFAKLSQSFDQFANKLQAIIQNVASISKQLSTSADESSASANNSLTNAQQQQSESANVATSINELLATSNEIASNIADAADSAEHGKQNAQQSLAISQQAGTAIESLASQIQSAQHQIQALEAESNSINKVISVIRDITDQTNLLALNAAIEAARAGEYGRGFAVVADEVRLLAQRTHSSTEEIEQTIERLHAGVSQSVALMEESQQLAVSTVEQTQEATEAVNRITEAITGISDKSLQIASASEQQAAVSAEIDKNIIRIAELATSTASAVDQSSTASKQVTEMAQELDRVVGQFKF